MNQSPDINKPQMKRSGVKELVNALVSAGVHVDDIVVERDPDGSVRVYRRDKEIRVNKLSALEKWELTRGKSA